MFYNGIFYICMLVTLLRLFKQCVRVCFFFSLKNYIEVPSRRIEAKWHLMKCSHPHLNSTPK